MRDLRWTWNAVVGVLVGIAMLVSGVSYGVDDDGIGMYFEINGRSNCLPEETVFPVFGACFLVLDNISQATGIAGWEGRVEATADVYLTLTSLGALDALNLGSGVEYVVGYGTPLSSSSYAVLAEFSIVFLGPGSVFVKPSGIATMGPGSGPKYVSPDESLVVMNYAYGGTTRPCLTAGLPDCPQENGNAGGVGIENQSWGGVKSLYR